MDIEFIKYFDTLLIMCLLTEFCFIMDSIISDTMNNMFYTYFSLYKISLGFCGIFFWICASYIDRVHMRERSRRFGVNVHNIISRLIISQTVHDKFRIFILRPLCAIFEIMTGFLEGVENFDPVISICSNDLFELPNTPAISTLGKNKNIVHNNPSSCASGLNIDINNLDQEIHHLAPTTSNPQQTTINDNIIMKPKIDECVDKFGKDIVPNKTNNITAILNSPTISNRRVKFSDLTSNNIQKEKSGNNFDKTTMILKDSLKNMTSKRLDNGSDNSSDNGSDNRLENGIDNRSENGKNNKLDNGIDNRSDNGNNNKLDNGIDNRSDNGSDDSLDNESNPEIECDTNKPVIETHIITPSVVVCENTNEESSGIVKFTDSINKNRNSYVRTTAYTHSIVQKQDNVDSKNNKVDTYAKILNNSNLDTQNKDESNIISEEDLYKNNPMNDAHSSTEHLRNDYQRIITKKHKTSIKLARRKYQN